MKRIAYILIFCQDFHDFDWLIIHFFVVIIYFSLGLEADDQIDYIYYRWACLYELHG